MFGLDPATTSTLLILAAAANPSICKMSAPTEINVIPRTEKVIIDKSMSLAEMQRQQTDTVNPYGFHSTSFTKGYASSPYEMRYNVEMDSEYLPRYRAYCIWYKKIDININLEPKITIATEVSEDKCQYKAVLDHEMKHVKTTRIVVNKYTQSMGKKVYSGLKQRGFVAGPIPQASAQATVKRMQETVGQLLDLEWRKMQLEEEERQGAVDSLEEYERVGSLCPHVDYSYALQGR